MWWKTSDLLREAVAIRWRGGRGRRAWALATDPVNPPDCLSLGSWFLRSGRAQGRGLVVWSSCCPTHSLEQAKNEGVETHGVTGELWELADFVVEAMQDLGGWA